MQLTPRVHPNGASLTTGSTLLGYIWNSEMDRWRSVHRSIIKARDTALIAVLYIRIFLDPTNPIRKRPMGTIVERVLTWR